MPLDAKRLVDLTENDILELIANGIEEAREIDYKQVLKIGTDAEKKEFLADVSSFGNASGGHLIFGVAEIDGRPTEITPLTIVNRDSERLRIESLVRDGISPRLPLELVVIPMAQGGSVLVLKIARSWSGPHMVSLQGTSKFYSRNSAGKYPLDVGELRSAFTSGAQVGELITAFRQQRLSAIVSGETPISLPESPKIILHFCPYVSTLLGTTVDIRAAYNQHRLIRTMYGGGFSPTFNFDGVMAYSRTGQTGQGYLQLFRDGKVECVETRGSGFYEYNQTILRSLLIEGACIGCTRRMFDLFRTLAVEPPCAVMLTLIGVKGHFLTVDPTRFDNYAIDRNTLIITPEVAENYDSDSAAILMRPMFDALWNATGLSQCGDYDASGQPTQELETVIQRMG